MEAAADFFNNVLGFEIRGFREEGGERVIEVAPPGAGTALVLTNAVEAGPDLPGADTGIRFLTRDLSATMAALELRGVYTVPERYSRGEAVSLRFFDPDNNHYVVEQEGP